MVKSLSSYQLTVEQLQCVRGEKSLFSKLSFVLNQGQLLFVQGKNGAGKTTLLRTLSGLSYSNSGRVLWNTQSIQTLAEEYAQHLLFIGHLSSLKEDLTAMENLQFFATLTGHVLTRAGVIAALTTLGIAHYADLPTRVLSAGQKRRVALARLWLTPKPLWILDEPFTALDSATIQLLTQHIEQFVESGGMVVLTSHQEPAFNSDKVQRLLLS